MFFVHKRFFPHRDNKIVYCISIPTVIFFANRIKKTQTKNIMLNIAINVNAGCRPIY